MIACDKENVNRAILLSARIRFSPTGASIRKQALEKIVEQALVATKASDWFTEIEVQTLFTVNGGFLLRMKDIRDGLNELVNHNLASKSEIDNTIFYKLNDDRYSVVNNKYNQYNELIINVVCNIYCPSSNEIDIYKQAFIELTCNVFSLLSTVHINYILKQSNGNEGGVNNVLEKTIESIIKQNTLLDENIFKEGSIRFFSEQLPEFDNLKWNMAQNYYIIKVLGIEGSELLTESMFQGITLFCDTNVLIKGLTPHDNHHNSFKELAKTCKQIGIILSATSVTIDELNRVIAHHSDLLINTSDRIPLETSPKVDDFLYQCYIDKRKYNNQLTVNEFLNEFNNPFDRVKDIVEISNFDDSWFENAAADIRVQQIAAELSAKYMEMKSREKKVIPANHDAIILEWIAKENKERRKTWLVTLDTSLVEWSKTEAKEYSNIITLDALLQWMTPVTKQETSEETLAYIFSTAINHQLLPVERMFNLDDFNVFNELDIATELLPAEDVERCIEKIRKSSCNLDPSKAEDREELGRIINGFFADPGREYKKQVEDLISKNAKLNVNLYTEKKARQGLEGRYNQLDDNLKKQLNEMKEQIKYINEDNKVKSSTIEEQGKRLDQYEENDKRRRMRWYFIKKCLLIIFLFIAIQSIIALYVNKYIEGGNLFEKMTVAWVWHTSGFGLIVIATPFIFGKDIMTMLKNRKGD